MDKAKASYVEVGICKHNIYERLKLQVAKESPARLMGVCGDVVPECVLALNMVNEKGDQLLNYFQVGITHIDHSGNHHAGLWLDNEA